MNLKKAFHKTYFLSVLIAVILIGGTSVSSLVNHDPVVKLKELSNRLPASQPVIENHKYTDVIEMDCGKKEFKSDALQIRLKGVLCEGLAVSNLKNMVVKNQNTGDSISVFKVDQNQITTDFIHLEKGENHISLKQDNKSYEVIVVR